MAQRGSEGRRVGFVLFVAMIILVLGVMVIGFESHLFGDKVDYRIRFDNISGLAKGSKVLLSGVPVGVVTDITFIADEMAYDPSTSPLDGEVGNRKVSRRKIIELTVSIERSFVRWLPVDSVATIETQGLLGDKIVYIETGERRELLEPDHLILSRSPPDLTEILAGGERVVGSTHDLVQSAVRILEQIRTGEGTLGRFLMDPGLYEELVALVDPIAELSKEASLAVKESRGVISRVAEGKGLLGRFVSDDAYAEGVLKRIDEAAERVARASLKAEEGIDAVAVEAQKTLKEIRAGDGTLGRLIREPTLYKRVEALVARIEKDMDAVDGLVKDIDEGGGALARLARDRELGEKLARAVGRLEETMEAVQSIVDKIDSGQGTAGGLVNDPSLVDSLRDLFLGVQDSGLLRQAMARAESAGRSLRLAREQEPGAVEGLVPATGADDASSPGEPSHPESPVKGPEGG